MPPLLVLVENISFEDVLGRKTTLQYDFFRYWAVSKVPVQWLHDD
jgi:hypothetical protein